MSEKTASEGEDTMPNITTAVDENTTSKQWLSYFGFISPIYPIVILCTHRQMLSKIAPEEETKLQRLRDVMADDTQMQPPKSSMKTSGAGFGIAGVLNVISLLIQLIHSPARTRWYTWILLANSIGMVICGVAYFMGYGDALIVKLLEIEWVEKWKKGMFLALSEGRSLADIEQRDFLR